MYSKRLNWSEESNDLTTLLCTKRKAGQEILDLVDANPTLAGFFYEQERIAKAFADATSAPYEPSPLGLKSARETLTEFHVQRGVRIQAEQLALTSSTSEAYSFLIKLLCDPGDRILTSSPGYPLIDFVSALESVEVEFFPMLYDGSWSLDLHALETILSGSKKPKAILLVHPANPTGSYIKRSEQKRLVEMSSRADVPIIVDEVFYDFRLAPELSDNPAPSFAHTRHGLVFVLGGLSKALGLPQMKLAWILATGEPGKWRDACDRLAHIADVFLSVGMPIQHALPEILPLASDIQEQIKARCLENLETLRRALARHRPLDLKEPEGGWYAVLRLPDVQSDEAWALELLDSACVYVYPGSAFGLSGCHLVVSLLSPNHTFAKAVHRIADTVDRKLKR